MACTYWISSAEKRLVKRIKSNKINSIFIEMGFCQKRTLKNAWKPLVIWRIIIKIKKFASKINGLQNSKIYKT